MAIHKIQIVVNSSLRTSASLALGGASASVDRAANACTLLTSDVCQSVVVVVALKRYEPCRCEICLGILGSCTDL